MPLHKSRNPTTGAVSWQTTCRKCSWKSRKLPRQVEATDARAAHIDAEHRTEDERAVRKLQAILVQAKTEASVRRAVADPNFGKPPAPLETPDPPAPDRIGWCHSCETYQLGKHARRVFMPWAGSEQHACVNCGDEPWGLGIWTPDLCPACADHYRPLAERQAYGYGIGCDHDSSCTA